MLSETSSSYLGTIQDKNVTTEILTDTQRHPRHPLKAVWGCVAVQVDNKWWLLLSFGTWWCLLVSHVVWRCGEGVWGVFQRVSECCLRTCVRFRCIWGCIWLFRPCIVQQMLFIGKALKVKIPLTWHFWNIKIPKPPYKSSLKIIGLFHFLKFLGLSETNYPLDHPVKR